MIRHAEQITLGVLIELLQRAPQEDYLFFDFSHLIPCGLNSYRGYYDDCAIGFKEEGLALVCDFTDYLLSKIGTTMTGYKGGDYKITKDRPLWAANYGYTGSTIITGVDVDIHTIIRTSYIDD